MVLVGIKETADLGTVETSGLEKESFLPPLEPRLDSFVREHGLSGREREILLGLLRGAPPKAIGVDIGCGYASVRTHLRRMSRKLGCSGTREIVLRFFSDAPR